MVTRETSSKVKFVAESGRSVKVRGGGCPLVFRTSVNIRFFCSVFNLNIKALYLGVEVERGELFKRDSEFCFHIYLWEAFVLTGNFFF